MLALRTDRGRSRLLRRAGPVLGLAALAMLAGSPPADAYRPGGATWSGRPATISYWNGTAYAVQVRAAAAAWNRSGARVRFVRASRARARVRIVYDNDSVFPGLGAHGFASIGFQSVNRVTLGRGTKGFAVMTGVIAHELGHILGLDHEDRRCATMNSVLWQHCREATTCSLLQADDVRGALARYGGRARSRPGELCPPAPKAVTIGAGPSGDVEASFRLPRDRAVTGHLLLAGRTCPKTPARSGFGGEKPGAKVTENVTPSGDARALEGTTICLRVWSVGENGRLSRRPLTRRFVYAPARPPAPASLSGSWDGEAAVLRWSAVAGGAARQIAVAWKAGETCPATPDAADRAGSTVLASDATTTRVFGLRRGRHCFAVWSLDASGRPSTKPAITHVDVPGIAPRAEFFAPSGAPGDELSFVESSFDPDGAIVSRVWDFGDGSTSNLESPSHVYAVAGTYNVTLTVTDDDGLTATATGTAQIDQPAP